jgi:hypothetical protein
MKRKYLKILIMEFSQESLGRHPTGKPRVDLLFPYTHTF